jgi:hypothetical protein
MKPGDIFRKTAGQKRKVAIDYMQASMALEAEGSMLNHEQLRELLGTLAAYHVTAGAAHNAMANIYEEIGKIYDKDGRTRGPAV